MVGNHELQAVLARLIVENHDNDEDFVVGVFEECLQGVGASPVGARPELVYRLASQRLTTAASR
jgi:hypothetical protein